MGWACVQLSGSDLRESALGGRGIVQGEVAWSRRCRRWGGRECTHGILKDTTACVCVRGARVRVDRALGDIRLQYVEKITRV